MTWPMGCAEVGAAVHYGSGGGGYDGGAGEAGHTVVVGVCS